MQEGSYSKIIEARQMLPDPLLGYLLEILMETLRDEVASCCESAYTSLPVAFTRSLLLINGTHDFEEYVRVRRWSLSPDSRVSFDRDNASKLTLDETVPADLLMHRYLDYAKELDRII